MSNQTVIDIPTDICERIKALDEYYYHDFHCTNCKEINYQMVEKGNRAGKQTIECSNCGCVVKGCD